MSSDYRRRRKDLARTRGRLEEVKDEIEDIDEVARVLAAEVEKLKIELTVDSRVKSMQPASTPRKQTDKRTMMAGVAGLGSFGLVLAGIAFLEFRSRRVASVDDVTLGLGLNLVGALPAWPRGRPMQGKKGQELAPLRNVLHESVDAMRTVLLRMAVNENLKSVMVTSAVEGEGKTSLACHLSSSLARAGRRTVLVDGDLAKAGASPSFRLAEIPRANRTAYGVRSSLTMRFNLVRWRVFRSSLPARSTLWQWKHSPCR